MYPKERNLHLQLSKDKQQVEGTLTSQGCCWQLELQPGAHPQCGDFCPPRPDGH